MDWICYCTLQVGIDTPTFAKIGINTSTCSWISIACEIFVYGFQCLTDSDWHHIINLHKTLHTQFMYSKISPLQSSSRPWTKLDTVTSNAVSAGRSGSGTLTVCRLNIFANVPVPVTCSSTNSKRGELIRNGNAWRWWRPNRRAFNCNTR